MARAGTTRSQNVEDLFNLKTKQFEPDLRWIQREGDTALYLQWAPVRAGAGTRVRVLMRESRRDVGAALTAFRDLAQACDQLGTADGLRLLDPIAKVASRYGTLDGDVPDNGGLARGTLDDWIVELLRFLDVWELAEALRYRSNQQAAARRIVYQAADAALPERFIFRPRTSDLDGDLVIASANERWTAKNLATGDEGELRIFERMKRGSVRTQLWIAFSTLVNRRMVGRFSLALHPFETASASIGIAPHGLVAMVYARLWLDVVTAREQSTPSVKRTCKRCGTPLPADATVRRKYCRDSGRCRQAYRRRQLAT